MLRSFSLFFIASFSASALNYVFQLVVARRLGAENFAAFSVEWSYLSLLAISGSVATYYATLNPITRERKRLIAVALLLLGLATLAAGEFRVAVACANLILGFTLGYALRRKDYLRTSLLNLGTAATRIGAVLLLSEARLNVAGVFTAVFASLLLTLLLYLLGSRAAPDEPPLEANPDWLAPVVLAVIGGLIPQIDVLWCARFPGGEAVLKISELALISKGVFFLQMILAQFLLPLEQKRLPRLGEVSLVLALAVLISAVAGFVANLVLPGVLHWSTPVTTWDFARVSLIGMGSSLFYALVQMLCKAGRLRAVFVAVGILLVQALLQGFAGFGLETYLSLTAVVYPILLLGLVVTSAVDGR